MTNTDKVFQSFITTMKLDVDFKKFKEELVEYMHCNIDAIAKLAKNYLRNKGLSCQRYLYQLKKPDHERAELVLVLMAQKWKKHTCVLLDNAGIWCTTPWMQMHDCKFVLLSCINSRSNGKYFVPTEVDGGKKSAGNKSILVVSAYEKEMEYFLKTMPPKVPIKHEGGY